MLPTSQLFPNPSAYCPTGGCPLINPGRLPSGINGLVGVVVQLSTQAVFLISLLSVIMVIWGALQFLIGGEKGSEKGWKIIKNAIIGVIIAALSFSAISLLVGFINGYQIN